MNKQELLTAIADNVDLAKKDIDLVLGALETAVSQALKKGDEVTLPGIGKLKPKHKPARTARNPHSGETIEVDAKTVVAFKAAKSLAEFIA